MDSMWDGVDTDGISTTAAKPKREDVQNAPTQQRMREGIKPAQQKAPSSDQKRVRRQQARTAAQGSGMDSDDDCSNCHHTKGEHGGNGPCDACIDEEHTDKCGGFEAAHATKESSMTQPTEADLLQRMATATSFSEQKEAQEALNSLRMEASQRRSAESSLDWSAVSAGAVEAPMPMITTASVGVASTGDWLDACLPVAADSTHIANTMRAEATMWYDAAWEELKKDEAEFKTASLYAAHRAGSQFAMQAPEASQAFLGHVAHLHKTAGFNVQVEAYYKEGEEAVCWKDGKKIEFFDGAWMHLNSDPAPDHNDVHPPNKDEQAALDAKKTSAWGDAASDAFAGGTEPTQPGPYTIPQGSHLKNPTNSDTFDGRVNGENEGGSGDPKTTTSDTPSLAEGTAPAGDKPADGVTPPITDEDANYAKDKSQGTGYTDPMPSGGKSASLFDRLRSAFAGGDDGLKPSDSPSLAEGTQPEGDHPEERMWAVAPGADEPTATFDKSSWGDAGKDYLNTGGTGNAAGGPIAGTPTTSSLREVGQRVASNAQTENVRVFGSALATMASLDETRDVWSGRDIVAMVLASGDVSDEDRAALTSLAADEGGNTCAQCGAKIERDPEGEENRTWHHADGKSHDHEAEPKASPKDGSQWTSSKESAVVPPFGRDAAWDGPDGYANEDDWREAHGLPRAKGKGQGRGNSFSLSDAKNEEGEWIMSPEEIRAEMAYDGGDAGDDQDDWYRDASLKTAGESVEVSTMPTCDICKYEQGKDGVPAAYDGKTVMGPWANMCEEHFSSHGVGLGTGKGQRLVLAQPKADPQYAPATVGDMLESNKRNKRSSKTAVHLTNVGFEDKDKNLGKGTDPSGKKVIFRLTDKEKSDLSSVLFSDMAGNFSGVDVEQSDIVSPLSLDEVQHRDGSSFD